jgi:hypothetical protein
MRHKASKISQLRTWGFLLTLAGMALMVLGTAAVLLWGSAGKLILFIFFLLGMITMLGSMAIYFWAGMLSTGSNVIECPSCGKQTKMIGTTDRCMFCKTAITLDPEQATE